MESKPKCHCLDIYLLLLQDTSRLNWVPSPSCNGFIFTKTICGVHNVFFPLSCPNHLIFQLNGVLTLRQPVSMLRCSTVVTHTQAERKRNYFSRSALNQQLPSGSKRKCLSVCLSPLASTSLHDATTLANVLSKEVRLPAVKRVTY